jgi:hypothetical protein
MEHIVMNFPVEDQKFIDTVKYGKRIELFLNKCGDFTEVQTITSIQLVLRSLDKDIRNRKLNYSLVQIIKCNLRI